MNILSQENQYQQANTSDSIPDFPDIYYEYKIEELNNKSPIELTYDETVKEYIRIYTHKRRGDFARIIGLSELYFPYIEEMLNKYNLPLELKYITVIESGLNPLAVSKSGAVGLWQFLYSTCNLFDLEVNSYIDERRDPFKSTEAACKYLEYLYNTFNDWQLAISSYNGGPGDVRKAIERNNGISDYWTIKPYLSEQAKKYVPAFVAAIYLMNNYQEHNIIPITPKYTYNNMDTIKIDYSISFKQIADVVNLTIEEIRFLNPAYKLDIIPENKKYSTLLLPENNIYKYLQAENEILGKKTNESNYSTMLMNASNTSGKEKIIHVVKKGEFFHKIALQYNCTLENIKAWNNIESDSLHPGQELIIYIKK